ncbi:hypothetical protein TNCV_213811, partial [Trichonephila clavipes]
FLNENVDLGITDYMVYQHHTHNHALLDEVNTHSNLSTKYQMDSRSSEAYARRNTGAPAELI